MCFALAANTSLLLMDEPSNGLDIPSKSQFRKVIASGMTDDEISDYFYPSGKGYRQPVGPCGDNRRYSCAAE